MSHALQRMQGTIKQRRGKFWFEWLSLRLWLPLGLLLLIVLIRLYTADSLITQNRQQVIADLQRNQAMLAMHLQVDIGQDLLNEKRLQHVQQQLIFLSSLPEVRTVLIADARGRIIAASRPAWIGGNAAAVDPDAAFPGAPTGKTWFAPSRNLVLSAYPVTLGANQTGLLFLAADPVPILLEHDARLRDWMIRSSWLVLVAVLSAWLLIHLLVSRRVGKLMRAADSFGSQQENVSSGVSGRDEIGRLGAAFDAMVRTQAQYSMKMRMLSQAVEQSAASVIISDRHGVIEFVNSAFTAITGYTQEEAIGKNPSMLSAGETPQETYQEMWDTINAGGTWRGEMLNRRKNGELYWDSVTISPVRDKQGEITHFVAVQEDITARKAAEEKLLLNMHILDSINEGVAVTDAQQKFCYVNPAFTAISGYSADEVLGKSPKLLSSGLMERTFYGMMWQNINEKGRWQGEIIDRRKNGESYVEWLSISVIKDERGQVNRYVSVFSDISERKAAERRVAHMAQHDFLTGLPNRMLLLDRLEQAINHARRDKRKVAVMFFDLDRFKSINDTLGHLVGDKFLKEVAERITRASRASDTVSRLGGDEFVVMLTDLEMDDIPLIAEKMLESVSGACRIDGHEIEITATIGISIFPDDGGNGETLLSRADTAMYHAKQGGRNNYQFFTAEMNKRALERMDIERQLRQALRRKEFVLHYQPQIDRLSGRLVGAEALLRWNSSSGLIPPAQFIPVAEETGQIIPIGEWVLREACRQNVMWRNMGLPEIVVSANLSTVQFRQKNLTKLVRAILEESGLHPSGLELEITESAVMNDAEAAIEMLYEIKGLGVRLAMDDFGTGYSSLTYLKRLPIDKLKIDQSFVRHMAEDADDAMIVSTIINMARNLGLRHIAEGVENEDQMDLLSLYGCDEVQGYHFGHPMPAGEFTEYLRREAKG